MDFYFGIYLCISFLIGFCNGSSFLRQNFIDHDLNIQQSHDDPGSPLFVTPLLEKGDYATAQKLSRVQLSWKPESYSGYFTVDKDLDSNLFFWFFPAQTNKDNAPVLLWLQGGPGGSSLFGLFVENGPVGIDKNGKVFDRNITWNQKYSMLYIDNPVGTGYSFTGSSAGYATNETQVAENLYNALSQFFVMFPNLKKNDFYLTGESYAGKYIPATAYKILMMTKAGKTDVKLTGVAIGDGFSDPPLMVLQYSEFLYQIGLLDENQRDYMQKESEKSVELMKQGKWAAAFQLWDTLLNGDVSGQSYFVNVTGLTDYYNYMRDKSPEEFQYYGAFVNSVEVRKAIHVGNLTYNSGEKVEYYLMNDVMQSVKPWLGKVMDHYRVCIYSGHLDIIVGLPLTQAMLQTVPWSGLNEYRNASRYVWKLNNQVAGYVRNVRDFYQIGVRGGGHILPYDQPERSFDMIDRFVSKRGFQ